AVRERLVQRLAAVVLELEGELLAEGRGDVAPPAGHLADGAHQLVGGRLLGEVARGTRLQGPHRIAILGVHAEDEHRAAGVALAQLLDELQAVLARHVVVEHRHLPGHLAGEVHDLLAVPGLPHDLEVLLDGEHLPQPLADYGVVVGDEDFHDGAFAFRTVAAAAPPASPALRKGIVTATRVPCPGVPVMLTSPPKSKALSCIPSSPSDLRPCRSSSAMPTPLSVTSSRSWSSASSSSMSTRVARA